MILVLSINILYLIKPFILFGSSVICYVLYWKHMKKVFSGRQTQTEPEILFITQNILYIQKRRKPVGKRKGHKDSHIFSIYPATVQKLRNLPLGYSAVQGWTDRIHFKMVSWHFIFTEFITLCESVDVYNDPSQFRPISLASNLEKIYRIGTKVSRFMTTISRSIRESKMHLNETQTKKVHKILEWKSGKNGNP